MAGKITVLGKRKSRGDSIYVQRHSINVFTRELGGWGGGVVIYRRAKDREVFEWVIV